MTLTEGDVASLELTYSLMMQQPKPSPGVVDGPPQPLQQQQQARFGPNYEQARELVNQAHPQVIYDTLLELIASNNRDVLRMLGEHKLLKDRTICVHGVPPASSTADRVSNYFSSRFGEVEDACVQYRATTGTGKANVVFKEAGGATAAMMNNRRGDDYMAGSSWNLIQFCCCRHGLMNNNYSGMLINNSNASASTTRRRSRALTEADFAHIELKYQRMIKFDSTFLGRQFDDNPFKP